MLALRIILDSSMGGESIAVLHGTTFRK